MARSTLVDVKADFLHQTEKAWLVRTSTGAEVWVPKSQCEVDPPDGLRRGQLVTVTCERAMAEDKGLV